MSVKPGLPYKLIINDQIEVQAAVESALCWPLKLCVFRKISSCPACHGHGHAVFPRYAVETQLKEGGLG